MLPYQLVDNMIQPLVKRSKIMQENQGLSASEPPDRTGGATDTTRTSLCSYAKNVAHADSDIDIIVVSDDFAGQNLLTCIIHKPEDIQHSQKQSAYFTQTERKKKRAGNVSRSSCVV